MDPLKWVALMRKTRASGQIKPSFVVSDKEGVQGWISIAREWRHQIKSLLVRVIVICHWSNFNQPMFHSDFSWIGSLPCFLTCALFSSPQKNTSTSLTFQIDHVGIVSIPCISWCSLSACEIVINTDILSSMKCRAWNGAWDAIIFWKRSQQMLQGGQVVAGSLTNLKRSIRTWAVSKSQSWWIYPQDWKHEDIE